MIGTSCDVVHVLPTVIYLLLTVDRFSVGPAWDDAVSFLCLGFISASMGLQGVQAIRLKTNSGATRKHPLRYAFA